MKLETQQKLSVIIPVYNAEPYLHQCLDSVLNQDLADLEVICVNDCSTDGSLRILREYEAADSRVIVLDNETNLRAGRCRNRGLDIAQGEYVHFLDADDYVAEKSYMKLYQTAVKYNLDVLRVKAYDLDVVTGEVRTNAYNALENVPEDRMDTPLVFLDDPQLFTRVCVAPWAGITRRAFLKEKGIRFNDLMCVNDRSFFSESVINAQRIMFCDLFLIYYRVNNSTSLVGNRAKYFDCHFKSYALISQASEQLPADVRRKYLENELYDICFWMQRFSQCEFKNTIADHTKQFLEALDRTPWNGKVEQTGWYKKIVKIEAQCRNLPRAGVENPLVSVVMPVYNAERYLAESLDSLLHQTLTKIEIICVDDGSTDRSVDILRSYAARDLRITFYQQKNQFAGVARNNGISHARGKYITFLDSDDIMLPDALETMCKTCEADGSDVLVSSARFFSEDPGKSKAAEWVLAKKFLPDGNVVLNNERRDTRFQLSSGEPWGKMYNMEFVRKNQILFPNLPRSEDAYFVYLSYALARKISILRKETVLYRRIPGNGLEEKKDTYPLAAYQCRQLLKEALEERGIYEDYKRTFVNVFFSSVTHHLTHFNTGDAFELLADTFVGQALPLLDIDLNDADYFHDRMGRQFVADIKVAGSAANYLYLQWRLHKSTPSMLPTKKNIPAAVVGVSPKKEDSYYKHELMLVHQSKSYQIGRAITFVPRKIRGGIRCLQENGVIYTMRRVKEKIAALFSKK